MGLWRRSVESLVVKPARPDPAFWRGRRVLVTGHTGFKGAWLCYWLTRMGARVVGLALAPIRIRTFSPKPDSAHALRASPSTFAISWRRAVGSFGRIRRSCFTSRSATRPAQLRGPIETFSTNVLGTAHVLESLRNLPEVKVGVMITTDKVYANREWVYPHREDDALGGHDPYSASKAACEIVISSYRSSFRRERGVAVASARAGNVIGGGD